jgi:hypothetical protein
MRLNSAKDGGDITLEPHRELVALCQQVGKMLGSLINNPRPFLTSDLRPLTSDF